MPDRVARFGRRLAGALALLTGLAAAPADGSESPAPPPPPRFAGGVVRFEVPDDATIDTGDAAWVGALEVHADGLVVNDVTLEQYVAGLEEMPSRWPPAALKAQAVAARTYGWYQARLATFDRYDTCATVACQVFSPSKAADRGSRWHDAVAATTGEVLTQDGAPILARYFSTSGGRTFDNDEVFPTEAPREYLRGVEDPDDVVSPFHRWTVRFTRAQFDELAARGSTLAAAVPVADVRREGDDIVATSATGTTARVTARALRDFLSAVAPQVYPDDFPGPRGDGLPLPTTVPSARFDVEVTPEAVLLHGRGWGHGVGMGQYGARGKAQRGLDYREILAAYYNGLEPAPHDGAPERIRVGLPDRGAPAEIRADRPMRVLVDGEVVAERALGTWGLGTVDGALQVSAPPGYGAPLEVGPTRVDPPRVRGSESVEVAVEVNKPVELVLVTVGPDGGVDERSLGVAGPGVHTRWWRPAADGSWQVTLEGRDETGAAAGAAATVVADDVPAPDDAGDDANDADDGSDGGRVASVAAVLVVLLGAAGAGGAVASRRRRDGRR